MSQGINNDKKQAVIDGQVYLGIEFGSTRIKSVLIDNNYTEVASGGFEWENKLVDGIWTYSLDDAWNGVQASYKSLAVEVKLKYGVELKKIASIGISGMMHGYIVFDEKNNQLVPFRTWRNTITEEATGILVKEFEFHVPQRYNIAHLYQAILNGEEHVKNIDHITTLAGYIHWKLCGNKVLGIGEASGVFPIDSETNDYDENMIRKFEDLIADKKFGWKIKDIMPKVLVAGERGGALTKEGANLLDPSGALEAGSVMCPPEGDAGTGMVATNSVKEHTGNVSAGTSVFAMIVLDKKLSKVYEEIDMVTTPSGRPCAMVHCNNFTSDLDAWVKLFDEAINAVGFSVSKSDLYAALYNKALEGDADGGGLLNYNFLSGEHICGFEEGRPLFVRTPESNFNLANFVRTLLFSAMGTLRIGMDILTEKECVKLDQLLGHGGLFKTKVVGQRLMAAAVKTPVVVMQAAGEGGAWGIALLAAYMYQKQQNESLESFLENKVFANDIGEKINPLEEDMNGFDAFIQRFKDGMPIERSAIESLK